MSARSAELQSAVRTRRDVIFALTLWETNGIFPAQTLEGCEQHAFALDLLGAVLRHRSSLEWIVKQCVNRLPSGDLKAALLLGAAQLLRMPGMAEHAAIAETVEAAKSISREAAGFVNAVLRRIQRDRTALLARLAEQSEQLQRDIPRALWTRWVDAFGLETTRAIADAIAIPPRVCIRPLPPYAAPAGCEPHPADPEGTFHVPRGVRVPDLDGFTEGRFVVQDAATRHAVNLLEIRPGQRVLDACAAPGGKTAQIAARLFADTHPDSQLIANEYSAPRLERLRDTLTRCGFAEKTRFTSCDATDPEALAQACGEAPFDRILLDVPCSNTGVFGRRPDARWSWSAKKSALLQETQAKLLKTLADRLAPGGRLVYSTCSIDPQENQEQVAAFLAGHPDFTSPAAFSVYPTPDSDGAYAALLIRR